MSSAVTGAANKKRKKTDAKPSAQITKCLNEKKRREQENTYIEELAELISACFADMSSLSVKPDKCAILQETVNQIRRIKDQEGSSSDAVQQGEVSSSKPTILANEVFGPLLLEALDGFLFVVNKDCQVEYVSENVEQFIKYTKEDILNRSIYNFMHVGDTTRFSSILLPITSAAWANEIHSHRNRTINCRLLIKPPDDADETMEEKQQRVSKYENMQIVSGTIRTKQDVLDYLTWTYFFRRLLQNPSYYMLETLQPEDVNAYLSGLVQRALNTLSDAYCIGIEEDERGVYATSMGKIASFYYLSHQTMHMFKEELGPELNQENLLKILSDVHEYDQMPVRHNEDILNGELAKNCPIKVDSAVLDSPHTKTLLLFQAHFSHLQLPCADYYTDLKSVLDQSIRILQAMIDFCAENGWLATTLRIQHLMQMVIQARWFNDSPILTLPHIESHHLHLFESKNLPSALRGRNVTTLPSLKSAVSHAYENLAALLRPQLEEGQIEQVYKFLADLPQLSIELSLKGGSETEHFLPLSPTRNDWIPVWTDCEYVLTVRMHRQNRSPPGGVHSPKFPRNKDEGWFLVLGIIENGELLALKRVSGPRFGKSIQQLAFRLPDKSKRVILTLYVMSDGYLGLDQQYDVYLNVVKTNHKDMS